MRAERVVLGKLLEADLRKSIDERLTERYNLTKVSKTDSVGFSEDNQKWYGWSHRAHFGFDLDSKVKKGDILADFGNYLVGYTPKTLDDCRQMAKDFSKAVS